MICFDIKELESLFELHQKQSLFDELHKRDLSLYDLKDNPQEMQKICNAVVNKGLKSKDDREIFVALDSCFTFYNSKESKVCFILNNKVQPKNLNISTLGDLKKVVLEDSLTDFSIWFNNGLRQFQLKQYTHELTTNQLFNFIKDKISGYGDMGQINLLIVLQGNGSNNISEISFQKLHQMLVLEELKLQDEVLILFNENNLFHVINQVYPKLKTIRKNMNLPEVKWNIEK